MGMEAQLIDEAEYAVEVAEAAIEEWWTWDKDLVPAPSVNALYILEADLCRARGALLAIRRYIDKLAADSNEKENQP